MNLAVFLPNWVGDAVMATPALRALRQHFRGARLVGVLKPYVAGVLEGGDWFDPSYGLRRQQAEAAGKDVRWFVSQLVEQAAAKPSLDEILAPLRKQFAQMNLSDEELATDITSAQADFRAQKSKKTA